MPFKDYKDSLALSLDLRQLQNNYLFTRKLIPIPSRTDNADVDDNRTYTPMTFKLTASVAASATATATATATALTIDDASFLLATGPPTAAPPGFSLGFGALA